MKLLEMPYWSSLVKCKYCPATFRPKTSTSPLIYRIEKVEKVTLKKPDAKGKSRTKQMTISSAFVRAESDPPAHLAVVDRIPLNTLEKSKECSFARSSCDWPRNETGHWIPACQVCCCPDQGESRKLDEMEVDSISTMTLLGLSVMEQQSWKRLVGYWRLFTNFASHMGHTWLCATSCTRPLNMQWGWCWRWWRLWWWWWAWWMDGSSRECPN